VSHKASELYFNGPETFGAYARLLSIPDDGSLFEPCFPDGNRSTEACSPSGANSVTDVKMAADRETCLLGTAKQPPFFPSR
jgi:hypothetical protein